METNYMFSICMIIKNAASTLNDCLKALVPLESELIIVDTGSTDNSIDIARKYTDKVYSFIWTNDFSEARNYSISLASNDMILVVDSDEILNSYDVAFEKIIISDKIGRIIRNNEYTRNSESFVLNEKVGRFFNKTLFRYSGSIHEQIVPISLDTPIDYYTFPLEFKHIGYDGSDEFLNRKANRNIELLKHEYDENPTDSYIIYQLGKSYYMKKEYNLACDYFEKGLEFDLDANLEYVQDMVETYGYALLNSGNAATALMFENIYEDFSNSCDFVFLMGLIYMNNELFDNAIEEFKKATTFLTCKIQGTNNVRANYNIGVIYECLNQKLKAIDYYRKCGNDSKAIAGLKRLQS